MSASGPNVGFGVSITFESGFMAFITNIDWDGISRSPIDTSNDSLTTPFWRTFVPGKLVDPGAITVDLLLEPSTTFVTPITDAASSVTLTWPKLGAQTTAATWAASGFMTDYKAGAPMDGVMTAQATVKFTGAITVTAGS